MAKQQLAITRFEGGLMGDPNPRDIGDNQFSLLKGFSVDSIGSLKMIGAMENHPTIDANKDDTTTFPPGYGLFSFSSDKSDGGAGLATDYLALTNGDYIHVWDDGQEGAGDAWNDMVDTVLDDDTGFAINEESTPNADATDHIWSFYAPDGDLRVSDGEFSNYNNSTKILKYSESRTLGKGDDIRYPTTNAQVDIGGDWIKGNASIEHGLDSNHLKMINLGSVTKGIVEGDAVTTKFIASVSGNVLTLTDAGKDHGDFLGSDDKFNGLTCSLFHATAGTIYGVVVEHTEVPDGSTTNVTIQTDPDGNGSGGTIQTKIAASSETDVTEWSFQIGQHEGYLWNKTLHEHALGRGVISSDYGVTLAFDEGNASSGSWMPTTGTKYKFYHTTTFDASTGSMKQQESAPSLFNMYPRKSAAGSTGDTGGEAHSTVREMFFCAGDTALDTDNTVGTAAASLAVNFGLIIRMKADNLPSSGAWNTNIGSDSYTTGSQASPTTLGDYNFLGADERVTGGRIYWSSSEDGFNSLNLLIDYDLEKGVRPVGSGSGQSSIGGYAKWQSGQYPVASNPYLVGAFSENESTWHAPPVLESYETINGFRHDAKLDAKFKTSVMANNRVYAGNIMRKQKSIFDSLSFTHTCEADATSSNKQISHTANANIKVGMRVTSTTIPDDSYITEIVNATNFKINNQPTSTSSVTFTFIGNGWSLAKEDDPVFQDRIVKSPVGKYDTFPDSEGYVIEGFNSDDGDEIIKLESFADRLLVFKKYKLQIYNIQKREFLEQEVLYNGLDGGNQAQACATDFGIAWINSKGVYFYDGRQVQSLTDGVLRDSWTNGGAGYLTAHWLGTSTDVPTIAFDPDSKKLFCLKTATASGSDDEVCFIYSFKTKSWTTLNNGSTIDNNTNKRFAHFKGQLVMDNGEQIKVWNDVPSDGSGANQQVFQTKDIDFGTPGVRKKIYKVYITYQSGNATTNVQIKYGVNGGACNLTFKDGDYFTDNELLAANGWQVAELKPTTSSEANNKKSFQLALGSDGVVPAAFEIDDITIVYRTKSVK